MLIITLLFLIIKIVYKKYLKCTNYIKKYSKFKKKIENLYIYLMNIEKYILNLNKKIISLNDDVINLHGIFATHEKEHFFKTVKINDDYTVDKINSVNLMYIFEINKSIFIKINKGSVQKKNIGNIIYIKNISNYDVYLLSEINIYINTNCVKVNKFLIRPFSMLSLILLEVDFFVILKGI